MDHGNMDHKNMSHMSHKGHEPMEHDMSTMSHADHEKAMTDPTMAKAMEKDMKDRFLWSLIFTIPIILYSPIFTGIFKLTLPTPIPINWLLLILTTPVVFKFGSIFPVGAYQALRKKTLNMMVLIAIGVLTAYIFSVFITFIGGETFFDAAAMLVTFVLFGHWMEMKSRRGTSDALWALFDLVPPQARVIRNGKEILLETSEVVIGDVMVLKPGDKIAVDGENPINITGGLKAIGHPVGATGVRQLTDLTKILRGDMKEFQGAELGLALNVGGSGATAIVSILGIEK